MESDRESKALVAAESGPLKSVAGHHGVVVPRVIAAAGDQSKFDKLFVSQCNLRGSVNF